MLENLENLIRENAQGAIVNNNAIPNEKNEAVIHAASTSIVDVLKQKLASGDINGLINSFKQEGANAGTTNEVSNTFTNKLQDLGINMGTAKSLASSFIPAILAQFTKKTNDPNDSSFDFQDIVSNISGADGKFQLSDLTDLFNKGGADSGGADEQTNNQGSIVDKLKGLF